MEENKYYVPEKEEFHIGFEFQVKYTKEGWCSEIYGSEKAESAYHSIGQLNCALQSKDWKDVIRVPYLSKEDIEAEGFSVVENHTPVLMVKANNGYLFYLTSSGENGIAIYQETTAGFTGSNILFNGVVKNKSKFKDVLKMIGV